MWSRKRRKSREIWPYVCACMCVCVWVIHCHTCGGWVDGWVWGILSTHTYHSLVSEENSGGNCWLCVCGQCQDLHGSPVAAEVQPRNSDGDGPCTHAHREEETSCPAKKCLPKQSPGQKRVNGTSIHSATYKIANLSIKRLPPPFETCTNESITDLSTSS